MTRNRRRHDDEDDDEDVHVVRPFMLTRGRTRATDGVVMESLISRKPLGEQQQQRLQPAQSSIWNLLESMQSAAEVSARLDLPLGVVLVLVSDMADLDLVEIHKTASVDDLDLVRRLIDGVLAL